jgi:esterase/lipase superfamily enzyme
MIRTWLMVVAALLALGGFLGCQRSVTLMSTPVVIAKSDKSPFTANPNLEETNLIDVFFATNRIPLSPIPPRFYSTLPGPSIYLGKATVRMGGQNKDWETLYQLSTTDQEGRRPSLRLDKLDEQAIIRRNDRPTAPNPNTREFFNQINAALAQSIDKDLTVYLHGANSNMAIAAGQAAQLRHFTGRNSVVLMFAWPSAERGMRYFTDVTNARATVSEFAKLLEFLMRNTNAKHINILAYSAGSQVLSPGLVQFRRRYIRDRSIPLRLGEIYYAAPDLSFPAFARQLPQYIDMSRRVTVSVNMNDSVLALSSWVHGISRLGRPNSRELSKSDFDFLVKAAEKMDFDMISVQPEVIPGLARRSHAFWYEHPWVSSDVIMKLLFHLPPAERGLQRQLYQERFPFWTFPADYDRRVVEVLKGIGEWKASAR